jgi:leader peptidase (prepilin peptidase) / N-methyltransferase
MEWWAYSVLAFWLFWVFLVGLAAGSFLNVLIFRLPFEKSVIWPGSRCGACRRSLPLTDNLPLWGYLRRRGHCGFCRTKFSSRYFWNELFCGLLFVGLFGLHVFGEWFLNPGLQPGNLVYAPPPGRVWVFVGAHALLLWLLLASALIDLDYKIIPTQITYLGTLAGIMISTCCPWPWPSSFTYPKNLPWTDPEFGFRIPNGIALWPAWEPPTWAPAGSWQLGLLTALVGAAAGSFAIRGLKFIFEWGFGQEAIGLGDADLLMMAGAFLGWQPVVLGIGAGAVLTLLVLPFLYIIQKLRGREFDAELPFGPGLAAGVVFCWLTWPILGEYARPTLFDPVVLGLVVGLLAGGLLLAGVVLRRGEEQESPLPRRGGES